MQDPRSIRQWLQWERHYSERKDAPPKGWRQFLRESWMNDQWADAYKLYLRSFAWEQRRNGAIRRVGGLCQMCDSGGKLHVHHISYERAGAERADDLRILCPSCHKLRHSVKLGAQPIPLPLLARRRREQALTGRCGPV